MESLHHVGAHTEQGILALELGAFINFGGIVEPCQRLLYLQSFLLRGVVPGIGIQFLAGIQVGIQVSQVRKHSCILLALGNFFNILLVPSVER